MERCQTCMGEGLTASEYGPEACPDCCGIGRLPSTTILRERRLRELEAAHGRSSETGQAISWLADEVRRSQHVLMQIMAAAMEAPDTDPVGSKVRFLANQALGLYPVVEDVGSMRAKTDARAAPDPGEDVAT